jgi:putative transposase
MGDSMIRKEFWRYNNKPPQGTRRRLHKETWMNQSKHKHRESTILQHCFWEHQIRDDNDLAKYIHFNPVKHSYVGRVCDWPYSTLHRYVLCRAHTIAWPGSVSESDEVVYGE